VTATAVYTQDFVFQGIRFEHRIPRGIFAVKMNTATINPRRLGYDAIEYSGQTVFEPVVSATPYYPNLSYGSSVLRRQL
jgi:hypothetical protein